MDGCIIETSPYGFRQKRIKDECLDVPKADPSRELVLADVLIPPTPAAGGSDSDSDNKLVMPDK